MLHARPHSTIPFGFVSLSPLKPEPNGIDANIMAEKQGIYVFCIHHYIAEDDQT